MGSVEKVGPYLSRRRGSESGNHAFGGIRRNLKFGAGLLANGLQHIGQGGVASHNGQLAVFVIHFWGDGGDLIERYGSERGRLVSRNRRILSLRLRLCRRRL